MIEWFTTVQVVVAVRRRPALPGARPRRTRCPATSSMGAVALVELLLHRAARRSRSSPRLVGNNPTGSLREFYIYLISALHPAARRRLLGADRAQPVEHRHPRRRLPRDRGDGVPDGPDLVRPGRLSGSRGLARANRIEAMSHHTMSARTNSDPSSPRRRMSGVGRVLVVVYGVLALAATGRSVFQIIDRFHEAPVAFTLSALSAARLHRGDHRAHRAGPRLVPGRLDHDQLRAGRRARDRHAEPVRSRRPRPARHRPVRSRRDGVVGLRHRLPVHPAGAAGARAAVAARPPTGRPRPRAGAAS